MDTPYMAIAKKFVFDLSKDYIKYIILDGSVNNKEDIVGYSDIDLKVFVKGQSTANKVFRNIRAEIERACQEHDAVFNVWTLLENDYPQEITPGFDFVRRYCLLSGRILYTETFLQSEPKDKKTITYADQIACQQALFSFQIRLRRLLTNPSAISDVDHLSVSFILQQSIAYLFHALRYYNAFNGFLCLTVGQIYQTYQQQVSNPFVTRLYNIRNNWCTIDLTFEDANDILYEVIQVLEEIYRKIQLKTTRDEKPLIYV